MRGQGAMIARLSAAAIAAAALALAPAAASAAPRPGSLDPSFNGSGVVGLGAGSQLFGVAVQPDGQIVAAGQSGGSVLVQRYTTGGALAGQYLGASGSARAVAIQPDGKIVIAGTSAGAMFVQRLTAGLAPDPSFGGGKATAFGGQSGVANGVAVGPGGVIVAVGSVGTGDTSFAVASFTSGGTLAWSKAFQPQGLPYAAANAVAVQPNNAIVIAGRNQGSPNYPFFNGLLVRLNPDGSYDGSFNSSGVVSYHYPGGGYTSLNAVALQNNGEIVAAGVDIGGPNAIFVRVNAGGSLDPSFSGGVAALPSGENLSDNPDAPIGAYGVGIAGGGRIVGAGNFENTATATDAAVWAFSPSGSPETGFGSDGVVRAPTSGYEACAFAIAPDGSLVSVGDTVVSEPDMSPCAAGGSAGGFIARYIGYGPPPAPQTTSAPTVTTGAASAIGEVSATVAGQVNPGGLGTSYHFDYGTSTSYRSSSTPGTLAAGDSAVGVSARLTGLAPGTTYHYRLVASNADGSIDGADRTVTTASAGPPSALSGKAGSITEVSTRVAGRLDPHGLPTTYRFEWGKTSAYGSRTKAVTLAASDSAAAVSARLGRLRPGTTYHYRLVASNADGTRYGADRTFTTLRRLSLKLSRVPESEKLTTLETDGIGLSVRCDQPCSIGGSLVIPASTAKRLKLSKRQLTIGGGSASLNHPGTAHLRLRLNRTGKNLIAELRGLGVALRIRAAPVAGGPTVGASRTISLTG